MVSFMETEAASPGSWDGTDSPKRFGKVHDMIDGVFEGLAPRFMKLTATSKGTEKDGVEAVAMLAVLREFSTMYLEWQDDKDSTGNSGSSNKVTISNSNNAAGIMTLVASSATPAGGEDNGSSLPPRATYFVSKLLHDLTTAFESVINQFRVEQIVWINNQKADSKSPSVLVPFYKFPTLLQQILEMTNGMVRLKIYF